MSAPSTEGTKRMDAKLKAKWVKALRSGNYPQTTNALRDEHGYCCLGVLCDVSDYGGWVLEGGYMVDGTYMEAELGAAGRHIFGVPDKVETMLIQMNDGGKTFKQIADYIEKNL